MGVDVDSVAAVESSAVVSGPLAAVFVAVQHCPLAAEPVGLVAAPAAAVATFAFASYVAG